MKFFSNRSQEQKNELTTEVIKKAFEQCADVQITPASDHITLIYCEGLFDQNLFSLHFLPALRQFIAQGRGPNDMMQLWPSPLQELKQIDELMGQVFNGAIVVFFKEAHIGFAVPLASPPSRTPEDPHTETAILGARDGFVEDVNTNVSLIRKRLKTNTLSYETYTIGARTHTKVALLYCDDIIEQPVKDEIKDRLANPKEVVDGITSSEQLTDLLSDQTYSLFPIFDYNQHPDYAVTALLNGRFVILIDNVPTAVIGPLNFLNTLKSSEDIFKPFLPSSFSTLVTMLGLIISIFLPGFWIALTTFHSDQIPLSLLATLTISRKGVPLPTPLEAILIIMLFELFREAGVRLPIANGQTIGVVGGLIIGDAAIRSGLTSPSVVVIVATSVVASFTLVHPSTTGIVTVLRLYILVCSSFVGLFGFFISAFSVLIYLSSIYSFGVPYLAPLSPFNLKGALNTVLSMPFMSRTKRPSFLRTDDSTRKDDTP